MNRDDLSPGLGTAVEVAYVHIQSTDLETTILDSHLGAVNSALFYCGQVPGYYPKQPLTDSLRYLCALPMAMLPARQHCYSGSGCGLQRCLLEDLGAVLALRIDSGFEALG